MKILILSPLFPPDVGAPANYCKELSSRLTGHEVTLLIYGYLPESVPGVTIVTVDKRHTLPERLLEFTTKLRQHAKAADLIIINNGPSTELPALLLSLTTTKRMILCKSDTIATSLATTSHSYKLIHRLFLRHCARVVSLPDDGIYEKPELLPYTSIPEARTVAREQWWTNHLKELATT